MKVTSDELAAASDRCTKASARRSGNPLLDDMAELLERAALDMRETHLKLRELEEWQRRVRLFVNR